MQVHLHEVRDEAESLDEGHVFSFASTSFGIPMTHHLQANASSIGPPFYLYSRLGIHTNSDSQLGGMDLGQQRWESSGNRIGAAPDAEEEGFYKTVLKGMTGNIYNLLNTVNVAHKSSGGTNTDLSLSGEPLSTHGSSIEDIAQSHEALGEREAEFSTMYSGIPVTIVFAPSPDPDDTGATILCYSDELDGIYNRPGQVLWAYTTGSERYRNIIDDAIASSNWYGWCWQLQNHSESDGIQLFR